MNQIEIIQNEYGQYQVVFWDAFDVDYPIGQAWNNFEDAKNQVEILKEACRSFKRLCQYNEEGE